MSRRTLYDEGCAATMPAKEDGVHRWAIGVVYAISPTQATAISHGARVNCDHENRVQMTPVACWDCAGPYDDVMADPCRAPARPV